MRHLDVLDRALRARRACSAASALISATLDAEGRIVHLNDLHCLTFGELDGARSARVEAIASAFARRGLRLRLSDHHAGHVGEMAVHRRRRGHHLPDARRDRRHYRRRRRRSFERPARRMRWHCRAPGLSAAPSRRWRGARAVFGAPGSTLTASMLRDIEAGQPAEGDQITRRSPPARGRRGPSFAAAHRLCSFEVLRGAPRADRARLSAGAMHWARGARAARADDVAPLAPGPDRFGFASR